MCESMSRSLTAHPAVPVADTDDECTTARSLGEHPHGEVTVVRVVEKTGGAPDERSLEQAEGLAEESFVAFQEVMPDVETGLVYGEDVVEGILDLAVAVDDSAIAFRPRAGSRLVQSLAGDEGLKRVMNPNLPVIAPSDTDAENG